MASTDIDGLTAAATLTGAEKVPVTQGGLTRRTTAQAIANLAATGYAVAALPVAPTTGFRTHVTDSNAALTAGIGAVVAGGGANVVPVFWDGTNYRIG